MYVKKTISAILSLCLLAGAFLSLGCQKTSTDVIRESIIERFEPYKSKSEEVASRLAKTAEDEGLPDMGVTGQEFADAVLDGFDYGIEDIKVSEKHATAQVRITSKSMSGLQEQLKAATGVFDMLGTQGALPQDYKTNRIHEMALKAIAETPSSHEVITLEFDLNGTEWKSSNATEELAKLDSIVFSG